MVDHGGEAEHGLVDQHQIGMVGSFQAGEEGGLGAGRVKVLGGPELAQEGEDLGKVLAAGLADGEVGHGACLGLGSRLFGANASK